MGGVLFFLEAGVWVRLGAWRLRHGEEEKDRDLHSNLGFGAKLTICSDAQWKGKKCWLCPGGMWAATSGVFVRV